MNKNLNRWKNIFLISAILILIIMPLHRAQGDVVMPDRYYEKDHQEDYHDYFNIDFIKQLILIFIVPILITTLFELPIFYLFLRKLIKFPNILKISFIINTITFPLLWIFIFLIMKSGQNNSKIPSPPPSVIVFVTVEIIGEVLVFIVETALIYILLKILLRKQKTGKVVNFGKSALISFCANTISATIGTAVIFFIEKTTHTI